MRYVCKTHNYQDTRKSCPICMLELRQVSDISSDEINEAYWYRWPPPEPPVVGKPYRLGSREYVRIVDANGVERWRPKDWRL